VKYGKMKNLINWFPIPANNFKRAISFYKAILCIDIKETELFGLDRIKSNNAKIIVPKTQISPKMGFFGMFIDAEGNKMAILPKIKSMKTLMTLIVSMLFTIFSLNSLAADKANSVSVIENVVWLLGTWEMRTSNGSIYETWELKDSFEMSGKSFAIKGPDTLVFETMQIQERNGKILYIPSVSDQNNGDAIIFESSFISRSKFIVENPEHDFPRVISYTRIGLDELVAEISGPSENGQVIYQTFSMKRMPDALSRNIELVQDVFRFFNDHNWEQMASLYANPSEFKDPVFGIETVMQTREEIIKKYRELNEMSPDIQDEILTIYPSGEKHVIVEFISSGTSSDGSKWKLPLVTIFTVENNLIVRDFTYYDK
jgi:hypothetical protein